MNLLVVDDENVLVDIIESLFLSINENIKIIKAFDGKEAFELYQKNKEEISFILTDVKMPHLTGLEFLTKVNELGSPPKSCLMSGFLPDVRKFKFDNALFSISKPFTKNDLKRLLERVQSN